MSRLVFAIIVAVVVASLFYWSIIFSVFRMCQQEGQSMKEKNLYKYEIYHTNYADKRDIKEYKKNILWKE